MKRFARSTLLLICEEMWTYFGKVSIIFFSRAFTVWDIKEQASAHSIVTMTNIQCPATTTSLHPIVPIKSGLSVSAVWTFILWVNQPTKGAFDCYLVNMHHMSICLALVVIYNLTNAAKCTLDFLVSWAAACCVRLWSHTWANVTIVQQLKGSLHDQLIYDIWYLIFLAFVVFNVTWWMWQCRWRNVSKGCNVSAELSICDWCIRLSTRYTASCIFTSIFTFS